MTLTFFDSFDEADEHNRKEAFSMDQSQKMILLEQLRSQFYPDVRTTPHRLQRVLRTASRA